MALVAQGRNGCLDPRSSTLLPGVHPIPTRVAPVAEGIVKKYLQTVESAISSLSFTRLMWAKQPFNEIGPWAGIQVGIYLLHKGSKLKLEANANTRTVNAKYAWDAWIVAVAQSMHVIDSKNFENIGYAGTDLHVRPTRDGIGFR